MEDAFDARAMIRRGIVLSIDDTGPVQTAVIQTGAGAVHADVEIVQPFGQAAVPPVDGCVALLFCVGGDPANMVAVLTNPSARFGRQAQGEVTSYAPDGSRVAVRSGGTVQVIGGNQVTISSPDVSIAATGTVTISAAAVMINAGTLVGNATVTGNLTVSGSIHAAGGVH